MNEFVVLGLEADLLPHDCIVFKLTCKDLLQKALVFDEDNRRHFVTKDEVPDAIPVNRIIFGGSKNQVK